MVQQTISGELCLPDGSALGVTLKSRLAANRVIFFPVYSHFSCIIIIPHINTFFPYDCTINVSMIAELCKQLEPRCESTVYYARC